MKISYLVIPLFALGSVACDKIDSLGGDDDIATQCLAFSPALKISTGFRHTIRNTCSTLINALEQTTDQRLSLNANESKTIDLPGDTPLMGACFEPFEPDLKRSNGKFQCRKK